MPGYRKHLWGGFVLGSSIIFIINIFTPCSLNNACRSLIFCLLGSLFPDIDIKSKGQIIFYRLAFVSDLFLLINQQWKSASLLGFLSLLPLIVHHRGIFHKGWFISIICFAISGASYYWYPDHCIRVSIDSSFFLLGALSHLLLDKGWRNVIF